jgi:hypothetical protein
LLKNDLNWIDFYSNSHYNETLVKSNFNWIDFYSNSYSNITISQKNVLIYNLINL